MIFMALNFVLENYFKDVLSLVDQSSDICDKILGFWFLSFNIFLWIIQIKQTFIAYDFGVLHNKSHLYGCEEGYFHESFKAGFSKAFHEFFQDMFKAEMNTTIRMKYV